MKRSNFNAGPSILPREVIGGYSEGYLDFQWFRSLTDGNSHAKDFQPVVDEAVALFKELLNIPEGYSVVLLRWCQASSSWYP